MQTLEAERRVDSGPLKVGDDWPGMFIRGDEALALANECNLVAKSLDDFDPARVLLERIARKLEACKV